MKNPREQKDSPLVSSKNKNKLARDTYLLTNGFAKIQASPLSVVSLYLQDLRLTLPIKDEIIETFNLLLEHQIF